MGIDADSQQDLALNEEDAENVVGGAKKKKAKVAQKAAPKMINVQGAPAGGAVEYVQPPDECAPDYTDNATT